ncbi:MAG: DUF1080 domain-containing protein [Planctomycetes bacterium]|nr:DUF1080 domain-containing protein [Planctomycetota bacterium]
MLLRIASLIVLAAAAPSFASASEKANKKDDGFDALDDFEKDFVVAFGDAKSWKVVDGVIQCSGKPNGYICTKKSYSNYTLTLEVRYPEQAGNTGILNYIAGKHKIWPACVEVQGLHARFAQIFAMGGAKGPRSNGDEAVRKEARKPHNEWNKLEITSKDGVISAKLNGAFIGKAGPYEVHKGQIGFQSEGAPVHFRNIRIKELE